MTALLPGGLSRNAGRIRRALPNGRRGSLLAVAIAASGLVALVGALNPAAAALNASPSATPPQAAASASTSLAATWGAAPGGGLDLVDLTWKGGLVILLLFITLRVLGRMQGTGRPLRSGHLAVLESRSLASKASLHLVAVGERRLVVGLTPSGMVALAELGADELPDAEAAPSTFGTGAATPRGSGQPSVPGISPALAPIMAPVDAFADRLASMLGKARTR